MKRWWAHAILIPIAVYLFQLMSLFNNDSTSVDQKEVVFTIPFLVVILLALFIIRNKIQIYLEAVDLKEQMDNAMEKNKKQ